MAEQNSANAAATQPPASATNMATSTESDAARVEFNEAVGRYANLNSQIEGLDQRILAAKTNIANLEAERTRLAPEIDAAREDVQRTSAAVPNLSKKQRRGD